MLKILRQKGMINMTTKEYSELTKKVSPNSKSVKNTFFAFLVGGIICTIGQALLDLYQNYFNMELTSASAFTSITLITLSILLTSFGLYHKIAKYAGAGTLVPITGFANAMSSPAIEYKSEGQILGTGAKLFSIAGPVIVYGTVASVIYGVINWVTTLF